MQRTSPARITRLGRRIVRRHYRFLAAACFCAAAGLAVHALTPEPIATVPVVVAVTDLPAGSVLAESDLRAARMPAAAVPPGASPSGTQLAGQRLASALREGSPVLDTSVVGPGLLAGAPPGTAAVPVRPADKSTVQLVAPGQLVDIVLSAGNGYEDPEETLVLADAVPVLWKADTAGADEGLLGPQESDGIVVVAASPSEAAALASASSRGKVFLVLVG
jgi:pilus assembly protein CpaB